MLPKNNMKELIRKQAPAKQRFGLRKLTIGVASVLLGFTFMGINASADSNAVKESATPVDSVNQQSTGLNTQSVVLQSSANSQQISGEGANNQAASSTSKENGESSAANSETSTLQVNSAQPATVDNASLSASLREEVPNEETATHVSDYQGLLNALKDKNVHNIQLDNNIDGSSLSGGWDTINGTGIARSVTINGHNSQGSNYSINMGNRYIYLDSPTERNNASWQITFENLSNIQAQNSQYGLLCINTLDPTKDSIAFSNVKVAANVNTLIGSYGRGAVNIIFSGTNTLSGQLTRTGALITANNLTFTDGSTTTVNLTANNTSTGATGFYVNGNVVVGANANLTIQSNADNVAGIWFPNKVVSGGIDNATAGVLRLNKDAKVKVDLGAKGSMAVMNASDIDLLEGSILNVTTKMATKVHSDGSPFRAYAPVELDAYNQVADSTVRIAKDATLSIVRSGVTESDSPLLSMGPNNGLGNTYHLIVNEGSLNLQDSANSSLWPSSIANTNYSIGWPGILTMWGTSGSDQIDITNPKLINIERTNPRPNQGTYLIHLDSAHDGGHLSYIRINSANSNYVTPINMRTTDGQNHTWYIKYLNNVSEGGDFAYGFQRGNATTWNWIGSRNMAGATGGNTVIMADDPSDPGYTKFSDGTLSNQVGDRTAASEALHSFIGDTSSNNGFSWWTGNAIVIGTTLPQSQGITTPWGVMPDPKSGIKNAADLPAGTTYAWQTAPDVYQAGETVSGIVRVTYSDGTYYDVRVPVTVGSLEANSITTPWGIMPDAKSGIKDADALPSGTQFTWQTEPNVGQAGTTVNGVVRVTNGTHHYDVTVPVKVGSLTAKPYHVVWQGDTVPTSASDWVDSGAPAGATVTFDGGTPNTNRLAGNSQAVQLTVHYNGYTTSISSRLYVRALPVANMQVVKVGDTLTPKNNWISNLTTTSTTPGVLPIGLVSTEWVDANGNSTSAPDTSKKGKVDGYLLVRYEYAPDVTHVMKVPIIVYGDGDTVTDEDNSIIVWRTNVQEWHRTDSDVPDNKTSISPNGVIYEIDRYENSKMSDGTTQFHEYNYHYDAQSQTYSDGNQSFNASDIGASWNRDLIKTHLDHGDDNSTETLRNATVNAIALNLSDSVKNLLGIKDDITSISITANFYGSVNTQGLVVDQDGYQIVVVTDSQGHTKHIRVSNVSIKDLSGTSAYGKGQNDIDNFIRQYVSTADLNTWNQEWKNEHPNDKEPGYSMEWVNPSDLDDQLKLTGEAKSDPTVVIHFKDTPDNPLTISIPLQVYGPTKIDETGRVINNSLTTYQTVNPDLHKISQGSDQYKVTTGQLIKSFNHYNIEIKDKAAPVVHEDGTYTYQASDDSYHGTNAQGQSKTYAASDLIVTWDPANTPGEHDETLLDKFSDVAIVPEGSDSTGTVTSDKLPVADQNHSIFIQAKVDSDLYREITHGGTDEEVIKPNFYGATTQNTVNVDKQGNIRDLSYLSGKVTDSNNISVLNELINISDLYNKFGYTLEWAPGVVDQIQQKLADPATKTGTVIPVTVRVKFTDGSYLDVKGNLKVSFTEADNYDFSQGKSVYLFQNDAQTKANAANKAASDAQNNVNNAQKAVDNDNEKINKASDVIKNAGHTPTADELNKAQKAVNDAKTATDKAQGDVDNAQSKANAAQNDVNAADKAVKDDQNALKNLNTPSNPESVADAQKKVDDDQTQIQKQTKTVNDQQQKVTDAQQAFDNAKRDHDTATADQKAKQDAANDAQSKADSAQTALNNAQKALDALNNQGQGDTTVNHIKVNQAYIDAMKNYKNSPTDANDQRLKTIGQQLMQQNQYQHNTADEAENVDWRNLTQSQRKELTIFAANLINGVRKAFGTKPTSVSPASVQMSKGIVDIYNAKNWDVFGEHMNDGQGHDVNDLQNYTFGHHYNGYSENVASGLEQWTYSGNELVKTSIQNQTMDSLKENIYDSILGFLFDDADSDWGHAKNTIGDDENYASRDTGIAYDKYGYLHVNEGFDQYGNSDLNKDAYSLNTSSPAVDPAQKAAAQKNVNDAKDANDKAQAALKTAKDALKTANDKVETTATAQTNAKKALDDANATLANDKATLTDLQNQLTKDQQALAAAQAHTGDATQAAKQKKQLEDKLAQDQTALKTAQDKLTDAKSALTNAQDALTAAKKAQTDAQTHLDNLKNHNVNVNDAQKQLVAAKAALKTDNAKLAAAKTALADAQSKAKAAADTLANAKAALAKINAKLAKDQKALNDAEDALKDDADRYGNGTKIADINVNMGAHNLKPTIANPQISADGQISVPGDASLQSLPFGTTAKWHDANKVAADAMHAGIYQELVDVMFPDGSQKTVAARLAVVDPNAKETTTPTTPAEPSDQTNASQPANGQAAVNGSTQKSQKASVAVKATKIRGQQKKTAKKAKKLPQTSDSHESAALAGFGFMLGLGTLLGMRKKRN